MQNIKEKKVIFFYSRIEEKQIFENIAIELKKEKIKSDFSKNLKKKAEIGFYCESDSNPSNSKISAIFLGGMDQGRVDWPNIWKKQPWNKFDLGFLPGNNWARRWKSCSLDTRSRPKYGVYNVGWPKADLLFFNKKDKIKSKLISKKYKINEKKINILYAPSFECFNRQIEVTEAVKKNNYNLIIKHWLVKRETRYNDLWDNIILANKKSLNLYKKNTIIVDPKENFLDLLKFTNLIITDESSVAYEGLLNNIPTISVKDWKIQRHSKALSRYVKPAKITIKTTKSNLSKTIFEVINRGKDSKINYLKKKEFSHLGESSKIIVKILMRFLDDKKSMKKMKYYLKPQRNKSFLEKLKSFL